MPEATKPRTSDYVRTRDKSKTINLYQHNFYGYQTCQGGDIPQRAATQKVLNQVVFKLDLH